MPICKTCGGRFEWALVDGAWILLEPIETHDDLDRSYVDEYGELRADHRDRHPGGRTVNAMRLDRKVPAEDAEDESVKHRIAAQAAKLVGRRRG